MNPMLQQAAMQQQMQGGGGMPMQPGAMQSPWMGMAGQQDPSMMQGMQQQDPMQGQMLAQGFPPAPQKQKDLSNFFKPKPSPMPTPGAEPYKGLTPTMVDQLKQFQNQQR